MKFYIIIGLKINSKFTLNFGYHLGDKISIFQPEYLFMIGFFLGIIFVRFSTPRKTMVLGDDLPLIYHTRYVNLNLNITG